MTHQKDLRWSDGWPALSEAGPSVVLTGRRVLGEQMSTRPTNRPRPYLIGDSERRRETQVCPNCRGNAHHVKRRLWERPISIFLPTRRWKCDYCGWDGLLPSRRGIRSRKEKLRTFIWLFSSAITLIVVLFLVFWFSHGLGNAP